MAIFTGNSGEALSRISGPKAAEKESYVKPLLWDPDASGRDFQGIISARNLWDRLNRKLWVTPLLKI